jgi:hypothetical protein
VPRPLSTSTYASKFRLHIQKVGRRSAPLPHSDLDIAPLTIVAHADQASPETFLHLTHGSTSGRGTPKGGLSRGAREVTLRRLEPDGEEKDPLCSTRGDNETI